MGDKEAQRNRRERVLEFLLRCGYWFRVCEQSMRVGALACQLSKNKKEWCGAIACMGKNHADGDVGHSSPCMRERTKPTGLGLRIIAGTSAWACDLDMFWADLGQKRRPNGP